MNRLLHFPPRLILLASAALAGSCTNSTDPSYPQGDPNSLLSSSYKAPGDASGEVAPKWVGQKDPTVHLRSLDPDREVMDRFMNAD